MSKYIREQTLTVTLSQFPMTIKKKTHGAYGAFFRDDIPADAAPKKIKF
jgi:ATP-dependent RNA helicase DBP3